MEVIFIALFSVATAVALVARRLKVPYTVALVAAGLSLGAAQVFRPPHLTKELLYAVFLPGLVFEAAFSIEFKKFWQNKIAVFSLAIPGLVIAIALTTFLLVPVANSLHFVDNFSLAHGFVFAALIAATDPIAVVALFKSLGAPKRLAVLIEGESLLNDGTAVVVFTIVLGAVTGGTFSAADAGLDFARIVGVGALIGAAVGFALSWVIHQVDDPMIEITLTTIAAYGSFVAAEHFHFSGVIATVVAGMISGNHAARTGMSPSTRVAVATFWEYLAFALNSIVFLLIGFEVRISALLAAWKPIVVAYLAMTLGRAIVLHLVALVLLPTREKLPRAWPPVLTWGGLRGGLSMVLALALPESLPHRELIVAMTFGVVILSIIVQGLTMGPLLRRLGLIGAAETRIEHERLRGSIKGTRAAIAEVDRMQREGTLARDMADEMRAEHEARIDAAEKEMSELHVQAESLREETRLAAHRRALLAEKDAIVAANRRGEVGEAAYTKLLADVDARLTELGGEH
ncbi:MAG: cation:proton antiporter [Polyangiaceae bacterium]